MKKQYRLAAIKLTKVENLAKICETFEEAFGYAGGDPNAIQISVPPTPLDAGVQEQKSDINGIVFKIFQNDKVNSILAAALQNLNSEQLSSLIDCLIEKTPAGEEVNVRELANSYVRELHITGTGELTISRLTDAFIAGFSANSIGKSYTKENMISLVDDLKNYTHESRTVLGYDERESIEFVELWQEKHKSLPATNDKL